MRDWIFINTGAGLVGNALMRSIVRQVAEDHGLNPDAIMGRDRHGHIAAARLEAYHRIRSTGRFSYPRIGRFFGRDHTTIVGGIKRHLSRPRALPQRCAERGIAA